MTPVAWSAEGAHLLEPAVGYALEVVLAATPELLSHETPTPCRKWNLRMLLRHACESLAALGAGIETGRVNPNASTEDEDLTADPVQAFRDRAHHLLEAWTRLGHQRQIIEIAGCPMTAGVMAATAALEVAVHGWDMSRACGQHIPIPRALATDLLEIAPALVPRTGRQPLFAAPVTVAATASPSDRLAGFLGRSSAWRPPGPVTLRVTGLTIRATG
jgi:uncharacterized protein (TIGR03086 family)